MNTGIDRQRTALRRMQMSSPMRHLLRFGFLDGRYSVFDYGCGRGDDLRLLTGMNVPATGWDPVYRLDDRRTPADVVNLGFVLNVIEDAAERRDTLRAAFSSRGRYWSSASCWATSASASNSLPFGTACELVGTRFRNTLRRTSFGPTWKRRLR